MFFSDDYDDSESRKQIIIVKLKQLGKKLLIIALVVTAICFYASRTEAGTPSKAVTVDKRAAAKEAIELYSEAHPEFTDEEIEKIFINVVH